MKTAICDYRGLQHLDLDRRANVRVYSLRAMEELGKEGTFERDFDEIIGVYVSLAEQYINWDQHPKKTFAYMMGETVTKHRLWASLADTPPRQAGRDPVVTNWPGGALIDMTRREIAQIWRSLLARAITDNLPFTPDVVLVDHTYKDFEWHPHGGIVAGGTATVQEVTHTSLSYFTGRMDIPCVINCGNASMPPHPAFVGRQFENAEQLNHKSMIPFALLAHPELHIMHWSKEHNADPNYCRAVTMLVDACIEWSEHGNYHDGAVQDAGWDAALYLLHTGTPAINIEQRELADGRMVFIRPFYAEGAVYELRVFPVGRTYEVRRTQ